MYKLRAAKAPTEKGLEILRKKECSLLSNVKPPASNDARRRGPLESVSGQGFVGELGGAGLSR